MRTSLVHELTPRLWVGANARWEDWSSFSKQWVTVGANDFKTQIDRGWKDTWGGSLGGENSTRGGVSWVSTRLLQAKRSIGHLAEVVVP